MFCISSVRGVRVISGSRCAVGRVRVVVRAVRRGVVRRVRVPGRGRGVVPVLPVVPPVSRVRVRRRRMLRGIQPRGCWLP